MSTASFARRIVAWQRQHGRHDLPWQNTRDPYVIWLSEIMLQQTQVSAVVPYFNRFLAQLPTVNALAAASEDTVLTLWSGLGYYSRARNLHRAARIIVDEHGSEFPQNREAIEALPGVGRSTAAAISAFAFGRREAILDGNVKRVFARHFGIEGFPGDATVLAQLWTIAESELPKTGIEAYTQGLMDLGATLCVRTRPDCPNCPVDTTCIALRDGRTTELPAPRPKKARPERRTTMLVLVAGDEVLLEKRPPSGIWGGLWSFPEIDDDAAVPHILRTRFGAVALQRARLPIVRHGFTHFALDIEPWLHRVRRSAHIAAEPGHIWLGMREARQAAIPVPVRIILDALLADQPALLEEVVQDH